MSKTFTVKIAISNLFITYLKFLNEKISKNLTFE